ncbi:MAG: pyruvate kinase [Ignavibacteria bacterium]|nr:pyruvate kinase [Ignavibacteria bacterium]
MIYKKTKIICTIGPAVDTVEKIGMLIDAGMDAARLNFSHGSHEIHRQYIRYIREASVIKKKMIAIIQDLPGPKIRVGKLLNGSIELLNNALIKITSKDIIGHDNIISTNYPQLINDVKKNEIILLDDGNLRLRVISNEPVNDEIECEVISGGILKERKGLNLPHTNLKLPSLTERDIVDLDFGLANDVDLVAMSFVRTAGDIKQLREVMQSKGKNLPVIAKIERPEAVENIDSIIAETDFIMVARGDMGVEISTEDVPLIQKRIIRKCNEAIKPVITATQMLESMITNTTPTRAEASDIANAILDGTDCVMLSAETSTGEHPILAVSTMKKIILKTETIKKSTYFKEIFVEDSPENTLHTICNSATEIATRVNAKAIITVTHTGKSPLLLSNHRPNAQIISATFDEAIIKRCKLIWGVESILITKSESYNETIEIINDKILRDEILERSDRVVIIAPMPFSQSESANTIQVTMINEQ